MTNSQSVVEIISDFSSRVFSEEQLETNFKLTPESIEKFNLQAGKFLTHIESTDKRNTGDNEEKVQLIIEVRHKLPKVLKLIPQIYVDFALSNRVDSAFNEIKIHAIAKVNGVKVVNQFGREIAL